MEKANLEILQEKAKPYQEYEGLLDEVDKYRALTKAYGQGFERFIPEFVNRLPKRYIDLLDSELKKQNQQDQLRTVMTATHHFVDRKDFSFDDYLVLIGK